MSLRLNAGQGCEAWRSAVECGGVGRGAAGCGGVRRGAARSGALGLYTCWLGAMMSEARRCLGTLLCSASISRKKIPPMLSTGGE